MSDRLSEKENRYSHYFQTDKTNYIFKLCGKRASVKKLNLLRSPCNDKLLFFFGGGGGGERGVTKKKT